MNLVEELLKADVKKADELRTGIYKSRKLAKIIGAKTETVDVQIKEIKSRRLNDIIAYQLDRKGRVDFAKSFDAKLIMCIEGVVDPDLTNKDLQKYFDCSDARQLAEKLFGNEINELADEISLLSGINPEEDEDLETEIKN